MVKTKEDALLPQKVSEKKEETVRTFKFSKARVIVWTVFGLVVAVLWVNPGLITQGVELVKKVHFSDTSIDEDKQALQQLTHQVNVLQDKLFQAEMRLNELSQPSTMTIDDKQLAQFREKMDAIEKQNLNVINSKADVALLLGVITRLDQAEDRLNKLAKISDDGALILSATMMVKERAEKGGSFEYEAEVLDLLAKNDLKIKKEVDTLTKYSGTGIHTGTYLSKEFDKIYNAMVKQQREAFEQTWKDRLNNKLNEIIKVKRVNKETPTFEKDKQLEELKRLVDAEQFTKAAELLDKPENQDLLADAALKKWLAEARAKVEFDKAVSRISTHSLALMKVNYISKETKND